MAPEPYSTVFPLEKVGHIMNHEFGAYVTVVESNSLFHIKNKIEDGGRKSQAEKVQ
jgi:hypothetical protein